MTDLLAAEAAADSPMKLACACGLGSEALPPAHRESSGKRLRLTRMRVGDTGRVCGGRLDGEDRELLRALGLRPDARVRLARVGEPCIVQVLGPHGCSCRIGLSRPLAERVIVETDDASPER